MIVALLLTWGLGFFFYLICYSGNNFILNKTHRVTTLCFKIQHWNPLSYISSCVFFQFPDCSNRQTIFFRWKTIYLWNVWKFLHRHKKSEEAQNESSHRWVLCAKVKKVHQLFWLLPCWITLVCSSRHKIRK